MRGEALKNKIIFPLLIFYSLFSTVSAQTNYRDTLLAPNPGYQAGWLHKFFFGDHWRDVWAAPFKVKILDLDSFAGGLTPIKEGGGLQTKSLRFKGNDNHVWKFRSMDKDPARVLPEVLQNTIAAELVEDQISWTHPTASLAVAPLLDTLKLLHSPPEIFFMPDDPKLGEFRENFANMLGTIEIHPDVDKDERIEFFNAEKDEGTIDLFKRLEKKLDEYVAVEDYLKARLLDLIIGDWDRHADQWKWARYTVNGIQTWFPVPRDRDQVFAKFDGLLVRAAEYAVPQFNDFGYSYNNIRDITWNGRFVDRHFLPEITLSKWDSVTNVVYNKITPEVIFDAVKKMPDTVFGISGEEIIDKLISRREKLIDISKDYYELINDVVDVFGSDKDDSLFVERISNNTTLVKLVSYDEGKSFLRFNKIFENSLTNEIRIDLLKGDDVALISGEVDSGPLLRIIGGKGKDKFIDSSKVNGYFLCITPIPDAENKTLIYDHGDATEIYYAAGTKYDNEKVEVPDDDELRYRPPQNDRGNYWLTFPLIGLDSDDGLTIGLNPTVEKYNFRAVPYEYKLSWEAIYATRPGEAHISFDGKFNSIFKNASINFYAAFSSLKFTQYFGYGNLTDYDSDLDDDTDFYRLKNRNYTIRISMEKEYWGNVNLSLGAAVSFNEFNLNSVFLLNSFPYGEYGLGKFFVGDLRAGIKIDTRDYIYNSKKGIVLNLEAHVFSFSKDLVEPVYKSKIDFRTYLTTKFITRSTLAIRAGAEKTWGKHPFFLASFLGGKENLRGYPRERFSGETSLFFQSEVRTKLFNASVILPAEVFLLSFAETGRVFSSLESSTKWHPSYGGGIALAYFEKLLTVSGVAAFSPEGIQLHAGIGMMF